MVSVSKHSKERIVERTDGVNSFAEAKKLAKQAWRSGKTINHFQKCENFSNYLRTKRDQTRTCSIRVYKNNIYIWRGKKTLVTVHPIPDRFIEEIGEVN